MKNCHFYSYKYIHLEEHTKKNLNINMHVYLNNLYFNIFQIIISIIELVKQPRKTNMTTSINVKAFIFVLEKGY